MRHPRKSGGSIEGGTCSGSRMTELQQVKYYHMIKTRFAPSPTGYIHLGNVRTALFSALMARKQQGKFLLRIEDTDQLRSGAEFAEQLQYDLHWLGLEWQEGPGIGGEHGPYYQSQRQSIYAEYYNHLEQHHLAYHCFCSEQELAIARKVQLASGQPPRYPGTCRNLTSEQVAQKRAQGIIPTLRFRVPDNQVIEFNDFARGPQRFLTNEIGDFIIRRGDGTAAFFFCNAIDDAVMGVTHILRGEDHLTNTPRQLLLLQALGLPQPAYGHLALIIGPDGSRLSKRHGSRSLKVLHKQGYLPIAINNYLARLGHYYVNNALMNLDALAAEFELENLGKSPARFDAGQLLYWQKQAVQQLSLESFWDWLGEEVHALVPTTSKDLFMQTIQANVVFPEDAKHWAGVLFSESLVHHPETIAVLQNAGTAFFQTALTAVDQHGTDFKAMAQALQQTLNLKGKGLFQPLRVALTGQIDGPEMAKVTVLLGIDRIKQRLTMAKNSC